MIPKREKTTDISSEVAQGKMFKQRILKLADEASNRFMKGDNLNEVIAEFSNRENFNRLQIQRLIEEANTIAYNKKYDTVRKDNDRRISFELAELGKVIELMGPSAPPEEVNPNLVSGKPGDGEMNKAASIEPSYIHNPNAKIAEKREVMMEKKASFDKVAHDKEVQRIERSIASGIFKIANSLVMTEKLYKKANETFNTLLSEVSLSDELIAGIQKKASEITQNLLETKRIRPNFVVSLSVNPTEKVASLLLGEHSLIKTASDIATVEQPKVASTSDISSFSQLLDTSRNLVEQNNALQDLNN